MPRKTPYTMNGIRRLKCYRCKVNKATQQWNICADGNVYRAICTECDIALNKMVLEWIGDPNAGMKMYIYRIKLEAIDNGEI